MTQWRKQGDEQWRAATIPLPADTSHVLVFVRAHLNRFKCAKCGKSLNETPHLWWRDVLPTAFSMLTDKRYCLEHSPIAIETREVPTLGQHITTLYQTITGLTQRIADLEQRVAELEARRESENEADNQPP